MAKSTPAGRLSGPGAAGGADPGTNTTSKSEAVATGVSPVAGGVAIVGTVEEIAGEPGPGTEVSGFVVTHLHISSRSPAGFRRCGRRWGPEPVEVDAAEFSEDEIMRLFDEPELMVAAVTGALAPVAK